MPRKATAAQLTKLVNSQTEIPEDVQQAAIQRTLQPCCNCNKPVGKGYYGTHGNGGTCTKYCEDEYRAKKPSMIDFQIGKNTKGARHVDAGTSP